MRFLSYLYFLGYFTEILVSLTCKDSIPSNIIHESDYMKYGLTYKYTERHFISGGGFASVFSCRKYYDYHKFALKSLWNGNNYFEEVDALCQFQGSKNIVQITDWGLNKRAIGTLGASLSFIEFVIVTELAITDAVLFFEYKHHNHTMLKDFINLTEYINNERYFFILKKDSKKRIELKSRFVEAVINALTDMHSKNYIHRDLKWSNVLVFDNEGVVIKLADLGLTQRDGDISTCRGTLYSMAPELKTALHNHLFTSPICGKATDIYSLGVMIIQMFPFILHSEDLYNLVYPLIHTKPDVRPKIEMVKRIFQDAKRIMLHDVSSVNKQDIAERDGEIRKCQLYESLCFI